MSFNPAILKSAKEEWSNWLEGPELHPTFTIIEMRKWIENKPPLNAFLLLSEIIDVMQDEIDLLNMKLQSNEEELQIMRNVTVKRI